MRKARAWESISTSGSFIVEVDAVEYSRRPDSEREQKPNEVDEEVVGAAWMLSTRRLWQQGRNQTVEQNQTL